MFLQCMVQSELGSFTVKIQSQTSNWKKKKTRKKNQKHNQKVENSSLL